MKRDSKITNYIKKICKNLNFTAISIKKLSNKCTITMIWYNKNEKLDKG
jgi:ribosomal protein S3